MDIQEFREKVILERLEIDDSYGRIYNYIDFSNVNKWFEYDTQDWNNRLIDPGFHLGIDIEKLKQFSDIVGIKTRLYYGEDSANFGSTKFTDALRIVFGKKEYKQ